MGGEGRWFHDDHPSTVQGWRESRVNVRRPDRMLLKGDGDEGRAGGSGRSVRVTPGSELAQQDGWWCHSQR